jgi:hypothetical protein
MGGIPVEAIETMEYSPTNFESVCVRINLHRGILVEA